MTEKHTKTSRLKMLKTVFGSILLISIVLGVGAAIGYKKYKMMTALPPEIPEHPEIVGFDYPLPVTMRNSTTTVGTVLAPKSVQLRTEVVGTVSDLAFSPGDAVSEGQTLLKLDTSVEEAQLAGAMAVLKIAKSTLKRTTEAASMRAISELELEQASAIMSQAESDVLRLQATIKKKTLKAPFAARAGLFEIQVGQYLPEGTQITMLQGIDEFVYIDFMMPQQVADELFVGAEVRLVIEPKSAVAKIIAVDSQADRATRNVMARARLDKPPASMQPNDSVRVELQFGEPKDAFTIPAAALRRSPLGPFVYVVEPDKDDSTKLKVRVQNVEPGKTIGQRVAILKGLSADQTVVSDGSFKLRADLWVVKAEQESAASITENEAAAK
jgi:membrane fusion protein (multidrug efflux system)